MTLDPGLVADVHSFDVVAQIFEGLVRIDASGGPVGVGAERWAVSPDGLTYTFTLRDGPRWSNGAPITAGDYVWAWKRNVDPRTAALFATELYPIANAARIHTEGLDPELLGVVAPDDRTLVVSLEGPTASFLGALSIGVFFPLPRDAVERHGDRWTEAANIVTNGPFLLREWAHDVRLVLERDDAYWGERPALERAVFRLFPFEAAQAVLAAYEAGEIDSIGVQAFDVPAADADRILGDPASRAEVVDYQQSATTMIIVNHRRPHLQDPRVRMALGAAIGREQLVSRVLRQPHHPASSLQPDGIVGRRPELWIGDAAQEAARLLAEAGYPDGRGFPELTLVAAGGEVSRLIGEYLQQQLGRTLGITLRLQVLEPATYFAYAQSREWPDAGELFMVGWASDFEDPSGWYNALLDSREDAGRLNTGWRDDAYDDLVRRARGELDPAVRAALYGQAEAILGAAYPHIPLYYRGGRTLVKPHVRGFQLQRVPTLTPLRSVSIAS